MISSMTKWKIAAAIAFLVAGTSSVIAQGITTGAIAGRIVSSTGEELAGVNVTAVHVASNTTYGTSTRPNGRFVIPNVRVGGPYTVTVSIIGYNKASRGNVFTNVSQTSDVDFTLTDVAIPTA